MTEQGLRAWVRFIYGWASATESLIWWIETEAGLQPLLMPNDKYRWIEQ